MEGLSGIPALLVLNPVASRSEKPTQCSEAKYISAKSSCEAISIDSQFELQASTVDDIIFCITLRTLSYGNHGIVLVMVVQYLITLRTLNYGNYGTFLVAGN